MAPTNPFVLKLQHTTMPKLSGNEPNPWEDIPGCLEAGRADTGTQSIKKICPVALLFPLQAR